VKRKSIVATLVIAGFCLFFLSQESWSADYSVTAANNIYQTTNETGSSCSSVILNYWSGSSGSRTQSSGTLSGRSSQTLTIRNAGSCSSIDISASCHYFGTAYTNYGKLSQTALSRWTDETKTQSLSCCHNVSIGLKVVTAGSNANTLLDIKCQ
jgi:hypothetical protein